MTGSLLAIDLGLKTAWSVWDPYGRLVRFESRRFPTRTAFKSGVPTIVRGLPAIDVVVAEGDERLARVWFSVSREWETELVQAQTWRLDVFPRRMRRSGVEAKESAVELASEIIKTDRCGHAGKLNHDTAEAILLGFWAVRNRGRRLDGP